VYQNDVRPAIRSQAVFSDYVSPEISATIASSSKPVVQIPEPGSIETIYQPYRGRRLHGSLSYAVSLIEETGHFTTVFYGGQKENASPGVASGSWRIGADYDLSPLIRLGVNYYLRPELIQSSDDYESFHGSMLEAQCKIVVSHRAMFFTTLARRLDVEFGFGFAYSAMTVKSHFRYPSAPFPERNDEVPYSSVGLSLSTAVDYYITPVVSVNVEIHQTMMPKQQVDNFEMHDLGYGVYVLESHQNQEIRFGLTELLLSLRLHFL
jgi:hypothetical protein